MKPVYLVDTGPLVAFLNRNERQHAWISEWLGQIEPPLLTCEAVIAEAAYLLSRNAGGTKGLLELIEREVVVPDFNLAAQVRSIAKLMDKYADVPMSLADACLVRMSELHAQSKIVTLDSDFKIYRRHSRQTLPLIIPESS